MFFFENAMDLLLPWMLAFQQHFVFVLLLKFPVRVEISNKNESMELSEN